MPPSNLAASSHHATTFQGVYRPQPLGLHLAVWFPAQSGSSTGSTLLIPVAPTSAISLAAGSGLHQLELSLPVLAFSATYTNSSKIHGFHKATYVRLVRLIECHPREQNNLCERG